MNNIAAKVDWDALMQTVSPNLVGKNVSDVISLVLPLVFIIAGILMLFYLFYSGFQYMMSNSDPKAMESARNNLTYAIIGFIVIFASYWMVKYLGTILNFTGKGGLF